jgi:hypothetical protein
MTKLGLVMVLVVVVGLTACGGETKTRTVTVTAPAEESAAASGIPILIETRITDAMKHTGEVADTSVFGETPFCPGGTSTGGSEAAMITSTFKCPGGTLKVRYAPTQNSSVQGATWEVVSGTGDWQGLTGGGSMIARFDGDDPDVGQEIFAGTVTR